MDRAEAIKRLEDLVKTWDGDPFVQKSVDAFKLAIAALREQEQSKWISVKERLPEPETDVIAFVGDYIDILSYKYDRRGNLAFMYMDDSGWWHERIRPSVTHWCEMPQPPKGE